MAKLSENAAHFTQVFMLGTTKIIFKIFAECFAFLIRNAVVSRDNTDTNKRKHETRLAKLRKTIKPASVSSTDWHFQQPNTPGIRNRKDLVWALNQQQENTLRPHSLQQLSPCAAIERTRPSFGLLQVRVSSWLLSLRVWQPVVCRSFQRSLSRNHSPKNCFTACWFDGIGIERTETVISPKIQFRHVPRGFWAYETGFSNLTQA